MTKPILIVDGTRLFVNANFAELELRIAKDYCASNLQFLIKPSYKSETSGNKKRKSWEKKGFWEK